MRISRKIRLRLPRRMPIEDLLPCSLWERNATETCKDDVRNSLHLSSHPRCLFLCTSGVRIISSWPRDLSPRLKRSASCQGWRQRDLRNHSLRGARYFILRFMFVQWMWGLYVSFVIVLLNFYNFKLFISRKWFFKIKNAFLKISTFELWQNLRPLPVITKLHERRLLIILCTSSLPFSAFISQTCLTLYTERHNMPKKLLTRAWN